MFRKVSVFTLVVLGALAAWTSVAAGCGGFFCQNQPVDQTGERIVFTVNPDGTITTLIEILYQGAAEDFSWILPIPEAITADDLQVPEDGDLVFDELHDLTDVQIIPPEIPDCTAERLAMSAVTDDAADASEVDIFASGEVGPFGFDVVGSEDPDALVGWLRDNNYRVTPDMEPLIDVYVELEMAFIAMRLLDGESSDSITPIEITYGGTEPMIPLQLTAVAAQPNMPVWVWIFGEHQAVPTNFNHMEIATEEITFFPFGGNDYTFLVQQRANAFDGHAFITEFARQTEPSMFEHEWLKEQAAAAPYLTRLNTYIDPEEMTADPTFGFDPDRADVSNVRDATELSGLYGCQRSGEDGGFLSGIFGDDSDAIDPMDGGATVVAYTPDSERSEDNLSSEATTTTSVDGDGSAGDSDQIGAPADGDPSSSGGRGLLVGILAVLAIFGLGIAAYVRRADT